MKKYLPIFCIFVFPLFSYDQRIGSLTQILKKCSDVCLRKNTSYMDVLNLIAALVRHEKPNGTGHFKSQLNIIQGATTQQYQRSIKQVEQDHLNNELLRNRKEYQSRIMLNCAVIILCLLLISIFLVQRSRQKLTIINASIKAAYHKIEKTQDDLVKQNEALKEQQDEIRALNNNLEAMVEERTLRLKQRNAQLKQYAFFNSHKMRSPITTILGLYNLLQLCRNEDEQIEVYVKIKESIEKLEQISRISQKMLDENDNT